MASLYDSVRLNLPKFKKLRVWSDGSNVPLEVVNSSGTSLFKVAADGDVTAGDASFSGAVVRTAQEYQLGFGSAKAGATAGWTVAAGANLYEWTCAAGATAATLVIPVSGLKVGDTITSFKVVGQIESAGNTATLDADLRALTNAAGDPTDASIGAITQVSVTADTAVAASKTALTEVVSASKRYYILVTATTAASTDIRLLGATVTVTTS